MAVFDINRHVLFLFLPLARLIQALGTAMSLNDFAARTSSNYRLVKAPGPLRKNHAPPANAADHTHILITEGKRQQ